MSLLIPTTGDIKNIYWYNCTIITLNMLMMGLILVVVVHAKYSRTKMLNRLSLAPFYAILAYITLNLA